MTAGKGVVVADFSTGKAEELVDLFSALGFAFLDAGGFSGWPLEG
jgi:hypothetical protein